MYYDINKIIDNIKSINKEKIAIVIEGNSGSGKTTLANKLSLILNCDVIHMDDFYLPYNLSLDFNNNVNGNINYSRFKEEIINSLNKNKFEYNIFSCKEQKLISKKIVNFNKYLIIEGSYSLNPILNKYYDYSIFLDESKDIQEKRLKEREKDNYFNFINKWVKLENNYFNYYKIKENVNIVIKIL